MRRTLPLLPLLALLALGCPRDKDDTGAAPPDADADGYPADQDCDDGDPGVHPGADEVCDGVDNDCDGETDEGAGSLWYADEDGDGYGDALEAQADCNRPTGFVADATDCDDGDSGVHPGAEERCDGVDDDCSGVIDDDYAADAPTWYADTDADGYGDAATTAIACSQPTGFVPDTTDCDDTDAAVNPAATERCNGVDDDCSGTIDDDYALDASTWHADADADGYGDAAVTAIACAQPTGFIVDDTDCDDTQGAVNPGATELCNGVDDDSSGTIDDVYAADAPTWYADADADGYGVATATAIACSQPTGFVADATDCDDTDAAVNPAATELCNGVDDDCSGTIDDDYAADAPTWYADSDADGYGDGASTTVACAQPTGFIDDDSDCDDTDAAANPAAAEICNGVDDDCSGVIDDDYAADAPTWYADADADGYGDGASTTVACAQPTGFVPNTADCDDNDAAVNPAATEICDGVDNDCSGTIDDDFAADAPTWYADTDPDGFGDAASTAVACSARWRRGSPRRRCRR
ncbi:MAG: putative metal-binding motif-containing protein, partial [Pseudomonadota bacterium]